MIPGEPLVRGDLVFVSSRVLGCFWFLGVFGCLFMFLDVCLCFWMFLSS